MTLMPIQLKPESIEFPPRFERIDYTREIIEVPNLITHGEADRLKEYAKNEVKSGLHRRGSKNIPDYASFYTCLIFFYEDPIYEKLNFVWEKYAKKIQSNITFIEPYEIKMYIENDKFGVHHDACQDPITLSHRKINLSLQLSDPAEYDGGDLVVDGYVTSREFGTGIFFPADVFHEVTPITKGTRVSLIGHSWGPEL
jgi:PKHD-type hydroxylase